MSVDKNNFELLSENYMPSAQHIYKIKTTYIYTTKKIIIVLLNQKCTNLKSIIHNV